jgi:acyl carrier protein
MHYFFNDIQIVKTNKLKVMDKNEISLKVAEILKNILNHQNFEMKDDLVASDVKGWDSLSHMAIITGIEDVFKIKFKFRELNKLKNMGSLLELIQTKI